MNKLYLCSFFGKSDGSIDHDGIGRQRLLTFSAKQFGGISESYSWNVARLAQTPEYQQHRALFAEPRGCGFWAWKPLILYHTLQRIPRDAYLIYLDIGKPKGQYPGIGNVITQSLQPFAQWAEQHDGIMPGVYIPHYGPLSQWTRRDCFVYMEADTPHFWQSPKVQAGYSAWKHTQHSLDILKLWLDKCLDRRLISDDANVSGKDNLDGFMDHRHDQSIFSILAEQQQLSVLGHRQTTIYRARNINALSDYAKFDLQRTNNELLLTRLLSSQPSELIAKDTADWLSGWYDQARETTHKVTLIGNKADTLKAVFSRYFSNAEVTVLSLDSALDSLPQVDTKIDCLVITDQLTDEQFIQTILALSPCLSEQGKLILLKVSKQHNQLFLDNMRFLKHFQRLSKHYLQPQRTTQFLHHIQHAEVRDNDATKDSTNKHAAIFFARSQSYPPAVNNLINLVLSDQAQREKIQTSPN